MINRGQSWALITGASSGFGVEFAKLAANDGYNLVIAARRIDKLEELAKEIKKSHNVEVVVVEIDLSMAENINNFYRRYRPKNGFDMVINNAGFGDNNFFVDSNTNRNRQMIELNITSLTELSQLALKDFAHKKAGYLMNVASIAGFFSGPGMAVYYATKNYVLSLTEAIAAENNNSGIKISALCPGATRTGFESNANIRGQSIFDSNKKLPHAAEVASYGYNKLKQGKIVAVYGLQNKFVTHVARRFMTIAVTRKIIKKISEK